MKTFAIIGLGRFGSAMSMRLSEMNAEVLAIDTIPEAVQRVSPYVTHAVVGDAKDLEVLKALGVHSFDCAVVAIGNDLAASVLTVMNLQELGVPKIVCKAHDSTHAKVLEKLGVAHVVVPEQEYAQRLARTLNSQNVLDYIELSPDYGILDVPAPKSWLGKSLKDLNVRAKLGVNIIAVENGISTNIAPGANYVLKEGDVLAVLGSNENLEAVQKL